MNTKDFCEYIADALNDAVESEAVYVNLKLTQGDLAILKSILESEVRWSKTNEATPFDPPKGKWIDKQGGFYEVAECSICHEKYPLGCMKPKFCPNCGHPME